jgi:TolB-like protein
MLVIKQEMPQQTSLFSSNLNFVQLNDYTQQIAMELKSDMPFLGLHGSIIVTPFVKTNGVIEEAGNLGHDLAEYLSHDLRDLGVSTSDQSLGADLYRTENGGIEFSVEQQELFLESNASYVLSGNMRQTSSGLMISSKIIELKSGVLVASNAKLLPNIIFNGLL